MTIRVLLVEDHRILREGTRELLAQTNDLMAIAKTTTGDEAIPLCKQLQPAVVVMDAHLPQCRGPCATFTQDLRWLVAPKPSPTPHTKDGLIWEVSYPDPPMCAIYRTV